MKTNRAKPVKVNTVEPNWHHAASGICCRADWAGAMVYDTPAGWIIAYSQQHADDCAREVLEAMIEEGKEE
jgi:hypothetical protein